MQNSFESRRRFVTSAGKFAAGSMVGIAGVQMASAAPARDASWTWPWPYAALDPDTVSIYAHDLFWGGKACCAGAFGGIIKALGETVGAPFTDLPVEIMLFGHGGGVGWGTLCGALNGSAAAISLVTPKAVSDKLINELMGWYTATELPTVHSDELASAHRYTDTRFDGPLPRNVCGSTLCHISVTEWCTYAGAKVADTARKERCARIAGDTAAKAVELLNAEFAGQFASVFALPASVTQCMSCHGTAFADNVAAKMECNACHPTAHSSGMSVELVSPMPAGFALDQNYPNPFNNSTHVEFSIPQREQVSLRIYDVQGRLVKTLVDHQDYDAGTYEASWDGIENSGREAASGVYLMKLQAGTYHRTIRLSAVK